MADIFVTNTSDSGVGSLRDAIAAAHPGDTIKFDSSLANRTITLTSGQLDIVRDLIIDGTGVNNLTISGNNNSRVIDVGNDVKFTLKSLTITDGKTTAVGEEGAGAAIRTGSGSTLTVEDSEFINNDANGEGGGAIFAGFRSTNTIINSTFTGNSTNGNGISEKTERGGGAIAVKSESSTTIIGSNFNNNTGTIGGAVNTLLGGLVVRNSTFTNNDSSPGGVFSIPPSYTKGYGGAIYVDGASATPNGSTSGIIEISNSRFEGNKGAGQGGALMLYLYDTDKAIISDSTIINNQVIADAKGESLGGGLRQGGNGDLELVNTTFANNQALQQGGGLWVGENTDVNIDNSVFYGNRAESSDGTNGLGGAIALINGSATTNISNTTIAENYAGFQGGAFWGGNNSTTTLTNTLVTDNYANNGGNNWNIQHDTAVTYKDGGGNVQSLNYNPNDTKIVAGVTVLNPELSAFVDNGEGLQIPPLPTNSLVTAGATATTTGGTTNNVPTLDTAIGDRLSIEDTIFSIDVSGNFSDSDGDTLSFSANNLPNWLTIDTNTGVISGIPKNKNVGSVSITVNANDGNGGSVSDTFDLNVANTNDDPIVTKAIGDRQATENESFKLNISNNFSDIDVGDTLTYTASNLPDGLSIDQNTGIISGTPTIPGKNTVTITAEDGKGGSVETTFKLNVANTNDAPIIVEAIANVNASEDKDFSLDISDNFSDADADTLTYTASNLPDGLSIDQ
ncbi:MAG: putative Ig domain-containing protein, partial [Oscillatoria sp. PMC 1051.18]|nr:putative Ig domain-containing protein [Oscillatoria sp. PMC 1051.18]